MGGPGKFAQWRRLKGPRAHFGAAGLLRQSRPGLASDELLGAELSPSARLRVALDELGPLFSVFGDYLALHADLLPQADCHDLTRSPGLERQCRQLSPGRDTLSMGLDDVRIIAAAVRAREQLGPTQTRDNLYRLVERGSKMLRRNAVASRRREDETETERHHPPSKAPANPSLSSLGIFLIISAAALIASSLGAPGSGLAGGDLMGTLLYALTGLVLLAHTARRKRRYRDYGSRKFYDP